MAQPNQGNAGTPKVSQPIKGANGANTQGNHPSAGHIFGVHTGGTKGK